LAKGKAKEQVSGLVEIVEFRFERKQKAAGSKQKAVGRKQKAPRACLASYFAPLRFCLS